MSGSFKLIPIPEDGAPAGIETLPEAAVAVIADTVNHYARAGYAPPWTGYLACENDVVVGSCAFVAAPDNNEVEIAYYTFREHEGRGVATRMAKRLIALARARNPNISLNAHTLPEENASAAILRKLAFSWLGAIEHPEDGTIWRWRLSSTSN